MNQNNLRQVIHDHMAQIAARHAAALYPHTAGDTAAQLFALLTDTALAYLMETEAELAHPGPGQSLAAAAGLTAKDTLLTGLAENLDLKNTNPARDPVNGWLAWRAANKPGDPPAMTSPIAYQRGDRIVLVHTGDPHTRLRPGDQGTVTRWDPAHGQLDIRWDSGSTLAMLLADGDRVRLITPAAGTGETGTEPGR
jgi:Domain of unknown function (DUF4314)